MNCDQFQKWIDEHGTGQRENKSCNGIDWVLVRDRFKFCVNSKN